MTGVRGRNKSPGEYRAHQNWIGSPNCAITEASFVPIPQEHLQLGLDQWEAYVHRTDVLDPLVQLAVVHAEFEALHPFMDGNGRLGRMIIPLFLASRRILSGPHFYISAYLEANRDEYLDRLRAVSAQDDWTGWCEFFLTALNTQAAENESKARAVLALYDRLKVEVVQLTHSQHSIRAIDFLFQTPIFRGPLFTSNPGIPKPTATRILSLLRAEGIVSTIREPSGRRPGLFAFRELMNIAEGRSVF
jgi:Fic family protein